MALERENVDKLSSEVETLCFDWRRLRRVVESLVRLPWWDLRTLTCRYCHEPFDINTGECAHDISCAYDSGCKALGVEPARAATDEQKSGDSLG